MFKMSKYRYLLNNAIPHLVFIYSNKKEFSNFEGKRVLISQHKGEIWLLKSSIINTQSNFKNRNFL